HDVAHRGVLTGSAQRTYEDFARVHAHAHLGAHPQLLAKRGERALHLERGPYRPLGVVLVGDWRSEEGDDGVADDLVDLATEGGDVCDQPFEAAVDEVLDVLGISRLGEGGEADEGGEEGGGETGLVW